MNHKGIKRKKRSFLQQSMKYHKKGVFGKGTRIDDEPYEYFLNVLKIMNQEFETEDDKKVFVENVFGQLDGNEVTYSSNQVVSRVIDNLLPFVPDSVLSTFMKTFYENIRPICMDQFASFVLQKLIITVTNRYLEVLSEASDDSDNIEEDEKLSWLLKVFRYVLNNLEEFLFSNYPNRIMRTVVYCLIGWTSTVNDDTEIIFNPKTPKIFMKLLKEFVDQLLEWSRFKECARDTLSSGFLQVLLQCTATIYPKKVKKLGTKLLNECFIENQSEVMEQGCDFSSQIPSVFDDVSASRLLETVIRVAPPKLFTQIYANCFFGRLRSLACHSTANYSVQKLIRFSSEKTEFEAIFDELSSCFEDVLKEGKSGVILELCAGCLKHKTKQSVFMLTWMQYLKCDGNQSLLAPLTIYMMRQTEYDQESTRNVQLHGSLLLQHMMKFNKPIKIISSLLEMKTDELCTILCNPKGSHIANAVFESEFVGEKSKEKFVKVLQQNYSALATSKHGSRVFDIVWQWANVKNRSFIAKELLEDEAKLGNSPFGKHIIHNISLGAYRRNKEDWIKAQNQSDKITKLFAKIVE